jgi:hypothetical protein
LLALTLSACASGGGVEDALRSPIKPSTPQPVGNFVSAQRWTHRLCVALTNRGRPLKIADVDFPHQLRHDFKAGDLAAAKHDTLGYLRGRVRYYAAMADVTGKTSPRPPLGSALSIPIARAFRQAEESYLEVVHELDELDPSASQKYLAGADRVNAHLDAAGRDFKARFQEAMAAASSELDDYLVADSACRYFAEAYGR